MLILYQIKFYILYIVLKFHGLSNSHWHPGQIRKFLTYLLIHNQNSSIDSPLLINFVQSLEFHKTRGIKKHQRYKINSKQDVLRVLKAPITGNISLIYFWICITFGKASPFKHEYLKNSKNSWEPMHSGRICTQASPRPLLGILFNGSFLAYKRVCANLPLKCGCDLRALKNILTINFLPLSWWG